MANVQECLRDGFSTKGTSGTGLGAIQRLCDVFDIHSVVGLGTALVAQLWVGKESGDRRVLNSQHPSLVKTRERSDFLELGVVQLAKPGQEVCGDAWAVETQFERSLILVADGLGSGSAAAVASTEAVRILQTNALQSPKAILEIAHSALRGTRGAAVAIAEINPTQQTIRFAGIGNIAGVAIAETGNRSLVSYNGIIGHQVRKIEEFVYPWSARSQLIMYSDGLGTQWSLDRYPGLLSHHPALIAGVLYRDFKRSHDDVTVLVAKMREIVSA
ncbi:MAG: SpoIIE family protein phosphatase [Rhizonema sp. PD38]|nr:SpoIIE family protein phosphatase [Rhizonema sp. PD38]